ncbi:MAG: terminase large subunit domain-containing protein [Desulfobacterales bacterium]
MSNLEERELKKKKIQKQIRKCLEKTIKEFSLNEDLDKIPTSDDIVRTTYNNGTEAYVDPLTEFYLCKKYFIYFISKYGFILDSNNRRVYGIKPFEFQRKLIIPGLSNNRFVIFRKSRQVGASVISGIYALWRANFNIAQDVLIISKTRIDAQDFKEKAIITYEKLPAFLKTKPTRDGQNMTTLKLVNKSRIVVRSQSPDAGRGGSWALVILDEAAFMPHADEIWSSIYPALSVSKGQCIIVSTSNGVGNFYHRMWIDAENAENDFYPIYIPWWKFPGRDNPWLEKIENKNQDWIEEQLDQKTVQRIKNEITKEELRDDRMEQSIWEREVAAFIKKIGQEALAYKGPREKKPVCRGTGL